MPTTTPTVPGGSANGQDCIQIWEGELEQINNSLLVAQANCDMLALAYSNALDWELKLKVYWESIQATNLLVSNVAKELELFKGHTDTICENIGCIKSSINIGFCIFQQTSRGLDDLRTLVNEMVIAIECLNTPGLDIESSKILAKLKEILAKIDAVVVNRDLAMTQLLDAWKCICLLEHMICDPCYGMLGSLEKMIEMFGKPSATSGCDPEPEITIKSCGLAIDPKPNMPPDCDVFYSETSTQYQQAVEDREKCKEDYDKAREEKENLLSCKNGLDEAIECAIAAKNC